MPKFFRSFLIMLLVSILAACNLPQGSTPDGTTFDTVGTKVALTLSALTDAAPQPTPLSSPNLDQSTLAPELPTNTPPPPVSPTAANTFTPSPTSTETPAPSSTPLPKPGTIEGSISGYPYGSLPKLVIVAYGQEPPYNYTYLITISGENSFSMTSDYMLPGKYQVVAYDSSDHRGGCPAIVTVISDQTVKCNITSWGGGYPAKPSGIPNP